MTDTKNVYRWKDIEIFGVQVPDFAGHSVDVYLPLLYGHLGLLFIFILTLIWVLYGYYQLGQQCFENQKFSRIFTFLLTPSAILTCLSGAYLYYISYVVYSSAPYHFTRGILYLVLASLYFGSVFYIFKQVQPNKASVAALSIAAVISSLFLVSSYLGVNYG